MSDKLTLSAEVGKAFSDKWYEYKEIQPDLYDDLVGKLKDKDYVVSCVPPTLVNRATLACKYVIDNVPKGTKVLDMACGIGFIACALKTFGYDAEGFDISSKAIERAKELAERLGQEPEMFSLADTSCLSDMPDASFDAVLAVGLFRYLDRETQDVCYRDIYRILKPAGKFLAIHQNLLFETFALNDGTIRFWADVIESYSDAPKLLGDKGVLEALNDNIKVPQRKHASHSISKHMDVQPENPLTYYKVAERYGFKLEKILYPSSHLMPPFMEQQVDRKSLNEIKRKIHLDHIEDWRAMFVEFEFLALMEKV